MANDAELRVGGNIDELKAATDKATVEVKRMADQMQASLSSLNSGFQKIHGTFMAFTAALAGGAAFKGVINASNEWAGDSAKLAKALSTTTEQASIMKVAMTHIGVETDTMVAASQKMSKQIFSNGDAFEMMGIKVKDSSGQYRPVLDVMGEANQKLGEIKNPIEQNIAGMQLYGKSWNEVKPILKLTADVMADAEQRAKELHLIVGPEGAAQARQYKEQMRDLNLVGKSLEVQFGQAVTPVFVKLGAWMGNEAPAMGEVFKNMLLTVVAAGQSVWMTLTRLGEGIGALAAEMNAVIHGDFAGAKAIYDDNLEKGQKFASDMQEVWAKAYDTPVAKASKQPAIGGPSYDFGGNGGGSGGGSGGKAEKSRMSAWESQISEAKVFFQKTYEMREYSKEQEMEYWQSILRLANVTGQERIAVTKKVSELELEIMKKKQQQQTALAAEEINEREKSAGSVVAMEELLAQREYDLGNISKQELLGLQAQYEDRRFQIAMDAQAARIAACQDDPNMDPVALQKLLDQMAEIQRAHSMRIAKISSAAAVESKNTWESALAPIGSAFEKTVTGMIQGTLTLRKGMANIFNSILAEFVSMCVKMGIKWAATELAKTLFSKEQNVVRTMMEKLGLIETTEAQVAASTTAVSTKATEATAVVSSNAAETASGMAASVASIPVVGWMLAAGAFAAGMALSMGAMGSIKSARGGYDIPPGVNPVTQLHEDEMVLPAKHANVIRDMAESGGGKGGGDVHLHVHTMDVKGVRDWMKSNASSVLAPALRDMNRRFVKV